MSDTPEQTDVVERVMKLAPLFETRERLDGEDVSFLATRPVAARIAADLRALCATVAALREERDTLTKAIRWALGEEGEFRVREEGEGAYWWRKDLRVMAFGTCGPRCSGCAGCQTGYEMPTNTRCPKCRYITANPFNCPTCADAARAATEDGR